MAKESGKRLVPDIFVTGDDVVHTEPSAGDTELSAGDTEPSAGDTELQDDEQHITEISTIEADETVAEGSLCSEDNSKMQDNSPVESEEEDKSQGDRHNHPTVQASHSSKKPTGEADVQELTVQNSDKTDSAIELEVVEKSPDKNHDRQSQEEGTAIKDEEKCTTVKNTEETKQGSSLTTSNLICEEEDNAVEEESDECDDEQTEDEDDDTNESESESEGTGDDNDDNSEMEETSEIEIERNDETNEEPDNEDSSSEAEVDFTIRLLVRRNSDDENDESESSGEPFSEELVPVDEPYKPREVCRVPQLESDLCEGEQKDGEDNNYDTTKHDDNDKSESSDDVFVEEFLVIDPPYNPDKKIDINLKAKDAHYGNKLDNSVSSSTETLLLYNTKHEKDNSDNDKDSRSGSSDLMVIDENVGNDTHPEEGEDEHKLDGSDDDEDNSLTSVETVIECNAVKKINKENDESEAKNPHSESDEENDHAIANDDFDIDEGEATADDAASIEDMEASNDRVYSDESSDDQTHFDADKNHPDTDEYLEPPTKKAKTFN